jgi:L-erythro-3,5-diaminohexanoate dehydrogenase
MGSLTSRIGADRVITPHGALPQPADTLDPGPPVRSHELEIDVRQLFLDSTSHRNIYERSGGDTQLMAARITEIIGTRGKMHNPETKSGGVLTGVVAAIGDEIETEAAVGDEIVSLASLTLTPLRLDRVLKVDGSMVDVEGVAYLPETAPWGPLPDDLPLATALIAYDVYGAASHTKSLAPTPGTIAVLGTGHAGKLALAAARDAHPDNTLIAVDLEPDDCGLADIVVRADLRDPIRAAEAVGRQADLVVNVVNTTGTEAATILLTRPKGAVLFYSMATTFQTAALTADGMSADIQLFIGNGFAPDRGSYALDLIRSNPALKEALT